MLHPLYINRFSFHRCGIQSDFMLTTVHRNIKKGDLTSYIRVTMDELPE
jgi:hypothetical protein